MGAGLEDDVRTVVQHGVVSAFPSLGHLRALRYYQIHASVDNAVLGVPVVRNLLRLAAAEFDPGQRSNAISDLLAVELDGKKQRKLTGEGSLREKAGRHFGIGWDHFYRTIESDLVRDFAEFLPIWDRSQQVGAQVRQQLEWIDIERAADQMWRSLERDFSPEIVVTMSGPGSFAAIYTMRLSPRDVPVVMAVTFPYRDDPHQEELQFRRVATQNRWIGLSTAKWSVFVPPVLSSYPHGSRVLVLDDRVISGETQALLHRMLTAQGLNVRCAALFGPRESALDGTIIARRIDGEFDMPWGPSRGRT